MVATALGKTAQKTMGGSTFTASAWTAGHLQHTIEVLKKRHPDMTLRVIQPCFHKGVKKSKGSHDYDGVFDVWIDGMTGGVGQRFLRSQGWAAWHRHTGDFADDVHIHMATIPPGLPDKPTAKQVGDAYAKLGTQVGYLVDGGFTRNTTKRYSSQIVDYYAHAFGLKNQHAAGSDTSWFPADINKTVYQPEEDDMTKEEMLEVLNSKEGQAAIAKAVVQSKIHGQAGEPKGGRMVGASITGIYNLLSKIAKKIDA
jgi:hypothetical protein